MLVYTVAQLLELSEGSVPEAFAGKVKAIYPSKGGQKEAKPGEQPPPPWKMQKLIICDPDGKEIEVMFDGRDDVTRAYEGSRLYVVAGRNLKGGLSGTKRKVNVWKDKSTPQVWVYDSADVSFEGANGQTQQAPARQQAPAQAPAANRAAPPPQAEPPDAAQDTPPVDVRARKEAAVHAEIKTYNARLAKNCAALNRCFDAALKLVGDVNKRYVEAGLAQGFNPSASDLKELATTLFIQTCFTSKVADIADFPMKTFQSYEKAATGTNGNGHESKPAGAPFR